jgi:FkbM family methyltransferase
LLHPCAVWFMFAKLGSDTNAWGAGTRMLGRLRVLLLMEADLWMTPGVRFRDRILYAISRFTTLPFGGFVWWFGPRFYSDNRLGLLLLPSYLREIQTLRLGLLSDESKTQSVRFVLDVGANAGQFARTLLSLEASCAVVSVEPNPAILPILSRNMKSFGKRWHVMAQAVGPQSRQTDFYYVAGKSGQGSVFAANAVMNLLGTSEPEHILIEEGPISLAAIEELVGVEIGEIDLAKIDVEGYELSALEGLSGVIYRHLWMEIISDRVGGFDVGNAVDHLERLTSRKASVLRREGDNVLFGLDSV